MKNSIYTLFTTIIFIAGATFLISCGSGTTNESESTEQHDMEGHDHDEMAAADHSCPMHPEIIGKKGDKCSKCGMFLTKTVQTEKTDTVAYNCPMHPNEKGVKGDKCSKCKMDLVASAEKVSMKSCEHKEGETCAKCSKEGMKCNHKAGEKCAMCSKKEGMKCDHKEGETCPNCKKA